MIEPLEKSNQLLPDFCRIKSIFVAVIIAELLAVIFTLITYQSFWLDLAFYSIFIQWVTLLSIGLLCVLRPWLNYFSELQTICLAYAIVMLLVVVCSEIVWWVFYSSDIFLRHEHLLFIARIFSVAMIIVGLVLRYFYMQYKWNLEIVVANKARFIALQAKIRPHFLFNSMNTIASLILKDKKLAQQAVEDLSELLHVSLLDNIHHSTLEDEFVLCECYLRMEKHRLGNRLVVNWQIDTLPNDAILPALSLQPLLENSIYYGIEPLASGGEISIFGVKNEDNLQITIKNPLPTSHSTQHTIHQGQHMAQENICARITTFFDGASSLEFTNTGATYVVTLNLPYRRQ